MPDQTTGRHLADPTLAARIDELIEGFRLAGLGVFAKPTGFIYRGAGRHS